MVWREEAEVVPYGHWDLAHACLRELVSSALFLTGTFGSSWFAVLEALQSADYVLTTRTAPPGPAPLRIGAVTGTPGKRSGTQTEGQVEQQQQRH